MATEEMNKPGKAGAILMGLLEIGIGLVGGLMGILIVLMPRFNPMVPASTLNLVAGGYFFLGVVFWVFALGTLLGKRWARALILIFSWFWLFCGVIGGVNMLITWQSIVDSMNSAQALTPQVIFVVKAIMVGVFTALFIVLPGVFVLYYGRKKAKENFKAWDPQESWTDRCPTPVLGISLCAAVGAVGVCPLLAFFHFMIPFFGDLLMGWPGAVFCFLSAVILGYCAWGTYRLRMGAWWTLFVFYVFWGVSTVWTFYNHSILEMDTLMGIPEAQLEKMKSMAIMNDRPYLSAYFGVIFLIYLGYLLFIRKYFLRDGK